MVKLPWLGNVPQGVEPKSIVLAQPVTLPAPPWPVSASDPTLVPQTAVPFGKEKVDDTGGSACVFVGWNPAVRATVPAGASSPEVLGVSEKGALTVPNPTVTEALPLFMRVRLIGVASASSG